MHPDWLSNAYLVADEDSAWAVFVDSGAPMLPLTETAKRWEVQADARAPNARRPGSRRARG